MQTIFEDFLVLQMWLMFPVLHHFLSSPNTLSKDSRTRTVCFILVLWCTMVSTMIVQRWYRTFALRMEGYRFVSQPRHSTTYDMVPVDSLARPCPLLCRAEMNYKRNKLSRVINTVWQDLFKNRPSVKLIMFIVQWILPFIVGTYGCLFRWHYTEWSKRIEYNLCDRHLYWEANNMKLNTFINNYWLKLNRLLYPKTGNEKIITSE